MDWGLKNRLSGIIKAQNNRALMLAIDHGYFLGPTEKLENPKKVIAPLLKYCDSLMVTRGVQRTCVPNSTDVPMVLRVSGGASIIGEDLSQEDITVSIKDAVRLNASALAMSIFVGSKYEHKSIVNLGKLVNDAEEFGIPVLAVTAVGKELGKDARYLSLACRIAAEQGAHIVKTYYCDNFEKVVESCPVPIIVAGGKKISELDALRLTYNAIKGGAVGVDMGRNIWQSEYPVAMIRAVRSIVHGNATVEQAYKLYQTLQSEKPQFKSNTPNQTKPQFKSNTPNQTKPQFKSNTPNQTKPQFKSNTPNQTKPQFKSNTPNQTKPQFKSKTPNQTKPQFKSNTPNQTKPQFKSNTPNQTKPQFKSNTPNQTKPQFKSNTPNQTKPQFKSNTPNQTKPQFKSNTPNQTKPQFKSNTPNQTKPQSKPVENKPKPTTDNSKSNKPIKSNN